MDVVRDPRLVIIVDRFLEDIAYKNFAKSISGISTELFIYASFSKNNEYICTMMAFSILADESLRGRTWYSRYLMYETLAVCLADARIDVNTFLGVRRRGIKSVLKVISMFGVLALIIYSSGG